jgi:hypothetical protein
MNKYNQSTLESNRFHLNIHRANNESIDIQEIDSYISQNNVDVLILRVPVGTKASQHLLYNKKFQVLHADTLVYYETKLQNNVIGSLKNDLEFIILDHSNIQSSNEIIPIIFDGYTNHYFSNPVFEKKLILEGYTEWAQSFTEAKDGKISWLVQSNKTNIAFATCQFNAITNTCEGILYGVHPDHNGKGIYSDIIRFTLQYFKNKNFDKMIVSTQIQNFAVQKSWVNNHFFLTNAFDTFHISKTI